MADVWLTTSDNPFDYFTEFEQWLQQDIAMGYHTINVVASRVFSSDGTFPEEDEQAIEDAIDRIIVEFPTIDYVKVTKKNE